MRFLFPMRPLRDVAFTSVMQVDVYIMVSSSSYPVRALRSPLLFETECRAEPTMNTCFPASCECQVSVDNGRRVAFEGAHNDQPSSRTFAYAFQSTARSGCAAQRGSRENPKTDVCKQSWPRRKICKSSLWLSMSTMIRVSPFIVR